MKRWLMGFCLMVQCQNMDKMEVLDDANPEPERPVLLPGWAQWTHIQQKKGLPAWMMEEHEAAKKKREDALKKRKDANLKHVIISEKIDKKAEKLRTKILPFPFTSKKFLSRASECPLDLISIQFYQPEH